MPDKNYPLPPEHYRRLINLPPASKHTLPSLKYLPYSLLYLFKSLPFPWENIKYVKVRYHHKNILTFVQDNTRVTDYKEKWQFIFNEMSNKESHILSFPIYDDNHPLINYQDIINCPLPPPFNNGNNTGNNKMVISNCSIKGVNDQYCNIPFNDPPNPNPTLTPNTRINNKNISNKLQGHNFLRSKNSLLTVKRLNLEIENTPYTSPSTYNSHPVKTFNKFTHSYHRVVYPYLYNNILPNTNILLEKIHPPLQHTKTCFTDTLDNKECEQENKRIKYTNKTTNISSDKEINSSHQHECINDSDLTYSNPTTHPTTYANIPSETPLIKHLYTYTTNPSITPISLSLIKHTLKNKKGKKSKSKTIKSILKTKYFYTTTLDWLEVALSVLKQSHKILSNILFIRNISYLYIDNNFNIKPIRTLTTKERKKSRLGTSFHLLREILKLLKHVVDLFTLYRSNSIGSDVLTCNIYYVFSHVGTLTGIYRYKYKAMRQIRRCKYLNVIIKGMMCGMVDSRLEGVSDKGNDYRSVIDKGMVEVVNDNTNKQQGVSDSTNKQQGVNNRTNTQQGVSDTTNKQHPFSTTNNHNNTTNITPTLWPPLWRVWLAFLRGHTSLLSTYLSNLSLRMINGRKYNKKRVTKQRIESNYDIILRNSIKDTVRSNVPPEVYKQCVKSVLSYYSEGWRCYKSNVSVSNDIGISMSNPSLTLDMRINNLSNPSLTLGTRIDNTPNPSLTLGTRIDNTPNPSLTLDTRINITNNTITTYTNHPLYSIINYYLTLKALNYYNTTVKTYKRILNNKKVDKTDIKKNKGKITRLYLKKEFNRQKMYLEKGPFITEEEGVKIYKLMHEYISGIKGVIYSTNEQHPVNNTNNTHIPFPTFNIDTDYKLLSLTLSYIKNNYPLNTKDLLFIEECINTPVNTLSIIKKSFLLKRTFTDIKIQLNDTLTPFYTIDCIDLITDTFLDYYLWYKGYNYIPCYFRPCDNEIMGVTVQKYSNTISSIVYNNGCDSGCDRKCKQCMNSKYNNQYNNNYVLVTATVSNLYKNIDLTLLYKLLLLIMDETLCDYIISRLRCTLVYKDIKVGVNYGVIKGIPFSGYVCCYYSVIVDIMLIGIEGVNNNNSNYRGVDNNNSNYRGVDNNNSNYRGVDNSTNTQHPFNTNNTNKNTVVNYLRYLDTSYILLRLSDTKMADLLSNLNIRRRLFKGKYNKEYIVKDKILTALYMEFSSRVLRSVCSIKSKDFSVTEGGESLYFSMGGFDCTVRRGSSLKGNGGVSDRGDGYNEVKDVNNKDGKQQGVNNSTYKQQGINNRTYKQQGINNSTCEQHPFNNTTCEQHPFNNTTSELHPLSTNNTHYNNTILLLSGNTLILSVSNSSINLLTLQVNRLCMRSIGSTFIKTVSKWNKLIMSFLCYYREGVTCIDTINKLENKVKSVIKKGINSKMPNRFPPVIFYSPLYCGGLNMYSCSGCGVNILKYINSWNKEIKEGEAVYKEILNIIKGGDRCEGVISRGMELEGVKSVNDKDSSKDNYRSVSYKDSNKDDYRGVSNTTSNNPTNNIPINTFKYDDLLKCRGKISHLLNKGLPRVSTLYNRDRDVKCYDKGYRIRGIFKKYCCKYDFFFFTDLRHDGKTWDVSGYNSDCVIKLGGYNEIYKHTLYNSIFESSVGLKGDIRLEGVSNSSNVNGVNNSTSNIRGVNNNIDKQQGVSNSSNVKGVNTTTTHINTPFTTLLSLHTLTAFEESLKYKKLTLAQQQGVNILPNKRFIFWWSPTLNRSNVYVGYCIELENTEIKMYGKLSTLKTCYLQVFRNSLWNKIRSSVVIALSDILDDSGGVNDKDRVVDKGGANDKESYIVIKRVLKDLEVGYCDTLEGVIDNDSNYGNNNSDSDSLDSNTNITPDKTNPTLTPIKCINTYPNPRLTPIQCINNTPTTKNTTNNLWLKVFVLWGDYDNSNIRNYTYYKYITLTSNYNKTKLNKYGVVLCIDLLYNTYSTYGYTNTYLRGILLSIDNIIKNNRCIRIMKERIRKILNIGVEDNKTIEAYKCDVIVDDSYVNRKGKGYVAVYCVKLGYLYVLWVNGCKEGDIGEFIAKEVISIVEKELGGSRLEGVSDMSSKQHPVSYTASNPIIICSLRKSFMEYLSVICMEKEGLEVVGCYDNMNIPFNGLVKEYLKGFSLRRGVWKCNVYEGWGVSSYTAFCRLMVILRGMSVNYKESLKVLGLECDDSKLEGVRCHDSRSEGVSNKDANYIDNNTPLTTTNTSTDYNTPLTNNPHDNTSLIKSITSIQDDYKVVNKIFPVFSDSQWIKLEKDLKDIVVNDYSIKNRIDSSKLTQGEIRDIIFGIELIKREEILVKHKEETDDSNVARDGEERDSVDKVVSIKNPFGSPYTCINRNEFTPFIESNPKSNTCINRNEFNPFIDDSPTIGNNTPDNTLDSIYVSNSLYKVLNILNIYNNYNHVISKELLVSFICMTDLTGVFYGVLLDNKYGIGIAILPQYYTNKRLYTVRNITVSNVIGFVFLNGSNEDINYIIDKVNNKNVWVVNVMSDRIECYEKGSETKGGVNHNEFGSSSIKGVSYNDSELKGVNTPGYFLVCEMWNFYFKKEWFDEDMIYSLKIGYPLSFYDLSFRE